MLPAIISVIQQIAMMFANPSTLSQLIDAAFAILNALADFFLENLPVFLEQAPVLVAALVDTLVENADRLLAAAVELIAKLVVGIVENLPKIVESGGKIVKSLVQGIGDLISDAVKAGTDLVKKIGDGLREKIADAKQWGKDLIQNFIDGILGMWESLKATVNKVAGVIGDFLGFSEPDEGPLSNFHTFAPDMMKLYAQGIHDNRDLVLKEVDALASMMNFSPEITGRGSFERNVSYKLAATGTTAARQIVVPVNLNGREIARATAVQMGEQLAWEEMQ
jgi:phage-related protein